MPPVSTPSSASAGPGSAIAAKAVWRSPSTDPAASRAARAASARPANWYSTRRRRASRATLARSRRTGGPAHRMPPPPGRAGWQPAHAPRRGQPPNHSRYRAEPAGRRGRPWSRDPGRRRCGQGQCGDRRFDRLGKRRRVEAGGGIVERDEVQDETRSRPRCGPARPARSARRAAAAAADAAAPPTGPRSPPAAPVRRSGGSRRRLRQPAWPGLARRQGGQSSGGRIVPGGREGDQPWAANPGRRPPSRGASERPARSGSSSWPHARAPPQLGKHILRDVVACDHKILWMTR